MSLACDRWLARAGGGGGVVLMEAKIGTIDLHYVSVYTNCSLGCESQSQSLLRTLRGLVLPAAFSDLDAADPAFCQISLPG